MTGHTKGPWEFDPPHDNGTYEGAFYSGDEAVCKFGDSETFYNTCGDAPSTANAHLIAAAPDMYEALKELVRIDNSYEQVTASMESAAFDAAEKAISKAEGK